MPKFGWPNVADGQAGFAMSDYRSKTEIRLRVRHVSLVPLATKSSRQGGDVQSSEASCFPVEAS